MSCGKVIASEWDEYSQRVDEGEDPGAVMDDLGLERYCCRRHFLAHANLIDEVSPIH